MIFRLLLFAAIALGESAVCAAVDSPPTISIVSVTPNTGGSSGGHSALRIDDRVYHFQVNSFSLLLLRRDSWEFFERHYRQLDNRSITLLPLQLAAKDASRIKARFGRVLAVQQKLISRWHSLKIEQQWFEQLGESKLSISIPIIAYFDSQPSENTLDLRTLSCSVLGNSYLDLQLGDVTTNLTLKASLFSRSQTSPLTYAAFPKAYEIESERRLEQLTLREALIILKQGRGITASQIISPDDIPLSKSERKQLKQLSEIYRKSIPRLLQSIRPDRGEALLLAIARYDVLRRSLKQNRLLLLNVFPTDERASSLMTAKETQRHHKLLNALTQQGAKNWQQLRYFHLRNGYALTGYTYQKMEDTASRYTQARDAILKGQPLQTCSPDLLLPLRKGEITTLKIPSLSVNDLNQARQQAAKSYQNYLDHLNSLYGYSLLHHNCTTELSHTIQSAFPDAGEITRALGATISSHQGLTLIPAVFTNKAQTLWNTSAAVILPSHRLEQSSFSPSLRMPLWKKIRESNRWTSTAYPGSINDSAFLFFSDGVPILRPLQGGANLFYGLSHVGVGLVTAVTENGRRRVKYGLEGMFYSFPEIIGISIRKGRYDILPQDEIK
ncbi:MAG: hypothetical protein L3J39_12185 [Verrucomicrobiales bacterium]|nr:hypothetical protein [Verrucomicrobiales bacterium]